TFLANRLRPEPRVPDEQVRHLIGDLDSSSFARRNQASLELQELGGFAETALRKALSGSPSIEVRRRVEWLVEQVQKQTFSTEQLRVLRALEVLEHIGTSQAQQVLKGVAGGTPESRLSQEAKASLERLENRSKARMDGAG